MRKLFYLLVGALGTALVLPALAAIKCTDPSGKVTYQDEPCASTTIEGQAEGKRLAEERKEELRQQAAKRYERQRAAQEAAAKVGTDLKNPALLEKYVCAAAVRDLFPTANPRLEGTQSDQGRTYGVFRSIANPQNAYGCYLAGNRVLWRVESGRGISKGRWRNDALDEKISYSVSGTRITIRTEFSDKSGHEKTYPAEELLSAMSPS